MLEPAAGTPNYLSGAPSALAMVALLAVGAGVTSIHGAQTGSLVTGKSSVTVSKSAAEAPGDVDPLPARRESLALQAARTLLFDPVFSAQLQRPQPPAGFNTNAQAADAATLLSRAKSLDDGVGKAADAIALYRQVLATPSVQRVYAAYSQFRIAQLTLETGDLPGAAAETSTLVQQYADFKDLFSADLGQHRIDWRPAAATPGPSQFDANGTFHYPGAGVELNAQGWSARPVAPSSGGGVALILTDPATNNQVMVWMMAEHVPSGEVPTRLGSAINGKILGRLSFPDYRLRPGSSRNLTINGNLALTALFDYTQNGQAMNELYTWVQSENSFVGVGARGVPASQLGAFQPRFDSLVNSVVLTPPVLTTPPR